MKDKKMLQTIILAAGRSVRFKSKRTKLAHGLFGKTMIERILEIAKASNPERLIVVVGDNKAELESYLNIPKIHVVHQKKPLGTGHALLQCKDYVNKAHPILVMNADTPLLRCESLSTFLRKSKLDKNTIHIVTAQLSNPVGYGRIIRNKRNEVAGIIEETECSEANRMIKEINVGFYLFSSGKIFSYLEQIGNDNAKGEYYLPDALELAVKHGNKLVGTCVIEEEEAYGINTRADLARAERILRTRKAKELMQDGVTILDVETCFIQEEITIGQDTIVHPGVIIEGSSRIGEDCILNSFIRIKDTRIGNNVIIYDHTVIESAVIEDGARIGPYARIRPETRICEGAKIGNFVELKKTTFGKFSKANHLTYLGDAVVGQNTNIGCGTITCNYDGEKKHPTNIEDNVFVGSDVQFVAPVRIGKGAYIAAGSTITEDVPDYALGIARGRQENKLDWVKRKKKTKE